MGGTGYDNICLTFRMDSVVPFPVFPSVWTVVRPRTTSLPHAIVDSSSSESKSSSSRS